MTVAALAVRLDALSRCNEQAVKDAATKVEDIANGIGRPVTIRRKKRRMRYDLGAVTKYSTIGTQGFRAVVYGKPTGFWVWQNTGTSSHEIPKRKSAKRARYLYANGYEHPTSLQVRHPGSSGRGAWRRVMAQAEQEVGPIFVDAVRRAIGN